MEFMEKPLILISWEDVTIDKMKLEKELRAVMDSDFWKLNYDIFDEDLITGEIIPINKFEFKGHIENYIKNIGEIIRYLNQRKIPYSTLPVPYRDSYEGAGILMVKNDKIVILMADDDNNWKCVDPVEEMKNIAENKNKNKNESSP